MHFTTVSSAVDKGTVCNTEQQNAILNATECNTVSQSIKILNLLCMLVLLFLFGNVFLMSLKKDSQVVRCGSSVLSAIHVPHVTYCGAPDAASAKCLFRRAGHRLGFLKNDKILQKLFTCSSLNFCCINLVHLQHLELKHRTEKLNVFLSWNWSRRAIRFET